MCFKFKKTKKCAMHVSSSEVIYLEVETTCVYCILRRKTAVQRRLQSLLENLEEQTVS